MHNDSLRDPEDQLPCDPIQWAAVHGDAEAQAILAQPAELIDHAQPF